MGMGMVVWNGRPLLAGSLFLSLLPTEYGEGIGRKTLLACIYGTLLALKYYTVYAYVK